MSNTNISVKDKFKDKNFNFFGTRCKVKFLDGPLENNDGDPLFGYLDSLDNIVYVSLKKNNGKYFTEEEIKTTLYHELVHLICKEGQYIEEFNDEPFVEWLARGIRSLEKSGIFNL